jgi:hypothetical protein
VDHGEKAQTTWMRLSASAAFRPVSSMRWPSLLSGSWMVEVKVSVGVAS